MDLTSLYYFSELAKDLHMTRTANRLFISQQTLSNHILRLEEDFGVKLLHRKPSLSLTYAGEHVLAFAQLVNKEHRNLTDILSDIEQQERGIIRFGASPLRSNTCLPSILPTFSARYPNVELRVTNSFSSQLEPMVLKDKIDFALILSEGGNDKLTEQHLMNDQVYLCVADNLLREYYGEEAEAIKGRAIAGTDVSDFAQLPFCILENRLGHQTMACFMERGISPKVFFSSTDSRISMLLCFQRLAACFATQVSLVNQRHEIPEDINIFPVFYKGEPLYQKISLIHRKDRYLTQYSRFFMDLLFRFFNDAEHVKMERMV